MEQSSLDRSVPNLRRTTEGISRRASLLTLGAAGLAAALASPFVTDAKKKGKKGKRKKKQNDTPKPDSPGPSPVTRLDAVCAGPIADAFGYGGNTRRAQTFTALSSGLLVMVQLVLKQSDGPDLDYDLRLSPVDSAGFPTNEILAQSAVANASVPVGISLVTFTFSRPFAVVSGTEYALALTRPGGGNVNWQFHVGDTCSGQMFVSANQTAPFGALDNHEFVFTTFVSS
jgi:hypothetical protein